MRMIALNTAPDSTHFSEGRNDLGRPTAILLSPHEPFKRSRHAVTVRPLK